MCLRAFLHTVLHSNIGRSVRKIVSQKGLMAGLAKVAFNHCVGGISTSSPGDRCAAHLVASTAPVINLRVRVTFFLGVAHVLRFVFRNLHRAFFVFRFSFFEVPQKSLRGLVFATTTLLVRCHTEGDSPCVHATPRFCDGNLFLHGSSQFSIYWKALSSCFDVA